MAMQELWTVALDRMKGVAAEVRARRGRVYTETRQIVSGNLANAWRLWDDLNRALAKGAVPEGRRAEVVRRQLDDKSDAVLPFMEQVSPKVFLAHKSDQAGRPGPVVVMARARQAAPRSPETAARRRSLRASCSPVAAAS